MGYPTFFDEVQTIHFRDPLGGFLGAFDNGELAISYLDCVKLAGHSCPTVASAYLMTLYGLAVLYPEATPERSKIKVEIKASKEDGVTGVIAQVISYIVGAGDEGGFKGIGGTSFSRNKLLSFDISDIEGVVRLSRIDTSDTVMIGCDTKQVPALPEMMPLMQKSMPGVARDSERQKFKTLWQNRVKNMLLDKSLQDKIITMTR